MSSSTLMGVRSALTGIGNGGAVSVMQGFAPESQMGWKELSAVALRAVVALRAPLLASLVLGCR